MTTTLPLYILCSFLLLHSVAGGPNGFSLKLIHRDSTMSPFYPGKLGPNERFKRLVSYTKARFDQLVAIATTSIQSNFTGRGLVYPNVPRLDVLASNFLYLALVGIGSFDDHPYMEYYFVFDTGSDIIWTQCEGCNSPGKTCFPQKGGPFPNTKSHTFRLKTEEPRDYKVIYLSGPSSEGVWAFERFTLDSVEGGKETINDIKFGCGLNQLNWKFKENNLVAGILGMGGGPDSFMSQLGPQAKGRFSYCLQTFLYNQEIPETYLRFGDDASIEGREEEKIHSTPILKGPEPTYYYLDLQDISIAGNRIGFHPGYFALRPDGNGGCMIDSGCAVSVMFRAAYDIVKGATKLYLWQYNLTIMEKSPFGLDLCYVRPQAFCNFPSITFHFGEDNLEVAPQDTFIIRDNFFCLAMLPTDGPKFMAIIGAAHQVNTKIVYDLNQLKMYYTKEDCAMWG